MRRAGSEERLGDLVGLVAERIEDKLIELPKRYASAIDMAVDVIHDEADKHNSSYAEAAKRLLQTTG